jgi:hypothetical protein
MFQEDRGWAGSFAVREISDRSVYDGGPNVNNLGVGLFGLAAALQQWLPRLRAGSKKFCKILSLISS